MQISFLVEVALDNSVQLPSCLEMHTLCDDAAMLLTDNQHISFWQMWSLLAVDNSICERSILAYVMLRIDLHEVRDFLRSQRRRELHHQDIFTSVSIHLAPPLSLNVPEIDNMLYYIQRQEWENRWIWSQAANFSIVLSAYLVSKKIFLSAFNSCLTWLKKRRLMAPVTRIFDDAFRLRAMHGDYFLWLHSHLLETDIPLYRRMLREAAEIEYLFFAGESRAQSTYTSLNSLDRFFASVIFARAPL